MLNKNYVKEWAKKAGIRAIKTFFQCAVTSIPTSAVILSDVNWCFILSASALAGLASLITSLAGIPEVKGEK